MTRKGFRPGYGYKQTLDSLQQEYEQQINSQWGVRGWLKFCLYFIQLDGYRIYIKKSRRSCSRYITVVRGKKDYTVRFSQHSNRGNYRGNGKLANLEVGGDTATITTNVAIQKCLAFFEQ